MCIYPGPCLAVAIHASLGPGRCSSGPLGGTASSPRRLRAPNLRVPELPAEVRRARHEEEGEEREDQ